MTNTERKSIRMAAMYRLEAMGVDVSYAITTKALCRQVQAQGFDRKPDEPPLAFLQRFNLLRITPVDNPRRALGRTPPVFRPLSLPPHPRLADIKRDQPPMITPNGIGNFKQLGGFMPVIWGAGR